ncbi:MAG: nitroreductase family deazaflavin-dependent oxidoreductase [Halioglobus sp.]|nr:nitroreductase family deazaflavin-dependent oxidoreductase [Halioglobus sp.]
MPLLKTDLMKNALESPRVVALLKRIVPPLDRALLRVSRGWVNTAMQSVVLLETVGARSGRTRAVPMLCMPLGGDIVVVGSNWGKRSDPAWLHNLRANPIARVHYRGYVGPVRASEATGEERQDLWRRLVRFNPQYARYQDQTDRILPVVVLRRARAISRESSERREP